MKKTIFRFVSLLAICTFIWVMQGCAAKSMPAMMKFDRNSEKGLLVGSVTFPIESARFDNYFFRLTDDTSAEFQITPDAMRGKHKGELESGKTYLFVIERPVGSYHIPSIRFYTGGNRTNYLGGFSIPYEIKKGEITYIGNIYFNEYEETVNKMIKLIHNESERDINKLKLLQPGIDWSDVKTDPYRTVEFTGKKARL